jgi:hypothetical protein
MVDSRRLIVKENDKIVEADIEIHTNDDVPEGVEINFLSKDEIVEDLLNRVLSDEEKESIVQDTVEKLNSLHPSIGSFIRNIYGLWLKPHPYSVRKSSEVNSAENISKDVIKMLKKRLA